jgi:hypothetical protein
MEILVYSKEGKKIFIVKIVLGIRYFLPISIWVLSASLFPSTPGIQKEGCGEWWIGVA